MAGDAVSLDEAGLLLSDDAVPAFWADCLETMVRETNVEIKHVVVREDDPGNTGDDPVLDFLERSFAGIGLGKAKRLTAIYRRKGPWALMAIRDYLLRLFYDGNPLPPLKRQRPIEEVPALADATTTTCMPEPTSGKWVTLPDAVVDKLAADVDVVIQMGFGLLEGRVLTDPEYGVLSFHYGDVTEYRGAPSGYWEYLDDVEETAVTVQQLTVTLDGGRVVLQRPVDLMDTPTWDDVRARLFEASVPMLATAVDRLEDPAFEPEPPNDLGTLHTWSEAKQLRNMGRCVWRDLRGLIG